MPRKRSPGLPSMKQILDFIATSDQPAGKREIARAFGLSGQDKIALKTLLKDMADEGLIDSAPGRAFHKSGGVPKVTVLRIIEADDSGNVFGVPEQWQAETPPPKLRIMERGRRGALGIGDRVLARTEERGAGLIAHPMKKLAKSAELVLGVIRQEGERYWLTPVEKKERRELPVSDLKEAEPGDLVLCEISGRPPRVTVRVEAIDEAHRVSKQPLGTREDLTHLPIVAIDPADARDHDDAIWAAPDDDEANAGGWKAIVAIADVSFYVRPGSSLDREARARANSVYFPDRVVPMLPEELSADICSLKAGQQRAAMACHLKIAKDGTLTSWKFTRAKICVAANIAYEDAQAAIDASGAERVEVSSPTCSMPEVEGSVPSALVETALKPLWGCWRALLAGRNKRDPLELDIPERRGVVDEKGRGLSAAPR